ncbi:NADH-quinone oxidoreductase subunit M [Cryptosporangium arvum]|uniref:NADH-quinone oxidoreductase subunit M n=1 Tax=Cryptosporangium arvum TaxID=80871 RepID=UPI0004BB5A55|nr:NADH-quinone oxidoreductase subunit M [Cryptosporangium arvum]
MNGPWLPVLTALPLVGAAVVAFLPKGADRLAKLLAIGWSLAVLVLTIVVCANFDPDGDRFQFVTSYTWIPQFGTRLAFGVDGIALVMLALIAVLTPIVLLASWHESGAGRRSVKTYYALMLALQTCMIGVFVATDVFFFYVFFEAMLVPMYFLIGSYGGPKRQYAAVKFFLYSLVGGLFMLASVIALYVVSLRELGEGTFAFDKLAGMDMSTTAGRWIWLGFFVAFAVKAPLFPFHTWLPDAGGQAPIGAAVLLVGVLDKVGTFGFLRYNLPLFPEASRFFAPMVIVLGIIGILYAALLAIGQNDMKRLVSYTSVAHFGFIAIGVFAFTTQGGSGAVLYMVNHGIATGALFLVVGFLIARRGSALIADYGGVGKFVPWIYGAFFVTGMASLALPMTNSFVSEFLVLLGVFSRNPVAGVVATLGIVVAALYVLWMIQRTMHGPTNPKLLEADGATPKWRDLSRREAWVIAPLLVLIIGLGVYPKPLLDVINPAVKATLTDVGQSDPQPSEVAGGNR